MDPLMEREYGVKKDGNGKLPPRVLLKSESGNNYAERKEGRNNKLSVGNQSVGFTLP